MFAILSISALLTSFALFLRLYTAKPQKELTSSNDKRIINALILLTCQELSDFSLCKYEHELHFIPNNPDWFDQSALIKLKELRDTLIPELTILNPLIDELLIDHDAIDPDQHPCQFDRDAFEVKFDAIKSKLSKEYDVCLH